MVERHIDVVDVRGSTPLSPTEIQNTTSYDVVFCISVGDRVNSSKTVHVGVERKPVHKNLFQKLSAVFLKKILVGFSQGRGYVPR